MTVPVDSATVTEIDSQPAVWRHALADRGIVDAARDLLAAPGERVLALGCGTSWFVAQSYAALRERAGLGETDAVCASEFAAGRRYDRVAAFSRSGTTTEVLQVLDAIAAQARRVVVTAVEKTPAADRSEGVLALPFADERSVVQTRFPTTVLALIRAAIGEAVGDLPAAGQAALAADLPAQPSDVDHIVFLGTGWTVGLAHEAALKVRETAQAWSESYPAMDFRHGPMAVTGPRSLVWAFGRLPGGMADTVAATGARLHVDGLDPLAGLVLAQRFATALAAHRGLNPDRPRLLTRSVILADIPDSPDPAPVG